MLSCISGAIAEVSSMIKDLKEVGVVIPSRSLFNSLLGPMLVLENDSRISQSKSNVTTPQLLLLVWFHCWVKLPHPGYLVCS